MIRRLIILLLIVGCGDKPQIEDKESSLDSQGIWKVSYFVDEFGDATQSGYISTNQLIDGVFSNSATTNTKLKVSLIIKENYDIAIKLFEYGGNHPIKSSSSYPDNYIIRMKHNGEQIAGDFEGINRSDRIIFGRTGWGETKDQRLLLGYLNLGGELSIYIQQITEYGVPSTYKFDIIDTSPFGFSNTWKSLTGKDIVDYIHPK